MTFKVLALIGALGLTLGFWSPARGEERNTPTEPAAPKVALISVYDNYKVREDLKTGWGFATVVKTPKDVILFDTGGDAETLLYNFQKMGIDPKSISKVFISHAHWDHAGGLEGFLEVNPNVTVFLPSSAPESLKTLVVKRGGHVVEVSGFAKITDFVYTTGEMYGPPWEQAMIIVTVKGLVVMTGCAHPGIAKIVKKVKELMRGRIYLVVGGFHHPPASVVTELKELGVEKVAPSHCTGDPIIEAFAREFGNNFIRYGVGKIIEISGSKEK